MQKDGFTLLEVMIAVLILGISMSSLFSAQATAIAINNYIRYTTVAGELARCKMSELELQFLKEGFEEAEFEDWEEGSCCELRDEVIAMEEDTDKFQCRWKIESVKLPSIEEVQTKATEAYMNSNVSEGTQGTNAQGAQAISGGILSGILPIVQDLLEQAIRKVTVEVTWQAGGRERSFQVVQYITNPAQGNLGNLLRQNIMEENMRVPSNKNRGKRQPDIMINFNK